MIITDVVAKTEYFDGTPAAGFEIELDEKKLKTDINGVASTKIKGDFYSRTLVSYNYINAKASLPEIGYVYEDMSFRSVNSDVEIKTKAKNDGDSVSLEIQTFNVDFTGLDDIGYDDADKLLRDFDGSLNLDVSIVRTQYRVLTGKKIYDPYTKTFTEEYGYRYEEKTEYSNNITVSGGKPQSFVFPFENYDASGSYKIVIRGKDKSGREFIRENYLYLNYYENDYDLKYVYCTDRSDNSEGYAIGDPVSISLYGSGKSVDDVKLETGTFLFIRASDRLIDYTVTKNNSLDFIFNGKVLPNIEVIGVWFDGRAYKTNNYGYPVKLNRKTRELNAEIETDKENYKPGETAKLRFKLTGPDKKPVKGYINVNIIDEALLSVSESFDDINSKVFEEYYEYSPEYVISHIMVDQERGAGGAGNGDGARSDFRDTALFKTVETDNNGAAEIDVKLPDNITSWRIFWQAFKTDDIMAGSGREETIKNTANLALAATLLDLPEGEKLFQYVLENQGVSDLYLLQQAMALRHKAQSVNRDAAFFDYVSDGKKTRVNLNISYSVMLTAEQLRSMKFENINQDIKAYVIYTAPGFPQGTNPMLSVSHKYTDVDSSKQNLTAGEISYSISESAPDGCYSIAHILPAGLDFSRIIRQNNRYDVWVSEVKGRQVTFTVYKEKNKKSGKISFYARPVMTGSFKYEGTFISNLTKPEFTNQSPGSMITIK